jgi:lipoprotein-releasing system ATP-binding protein
MTPKVLLDAQGLSKSYVNSESVRTAVLNGVDLKIYEGDLIALLGASGSGKSTLLYCLSLLDSMDSGVLRFEGNDISHLDRDQRAAFRLNHIGFVFQFHHLIFEMTVLENVLLPAQIRGVVSKETLDWAQHLLEKVGLSQFQQKLPSQLSGGEQQRVAVARALVNKPQLLFTDEATGNLDSKRASSVIELILQIGKENKTAVLSVTHDENQSKIYPKRLNMVDGKIVHV